MWDEMAKGAVEGLIRGILDRGKKTKAEVTDVVEARHFVLRDDADRGRAILAMAEGGPSLFLLNQREEVRVALWINEEVACLRLYGADRTTQALLRVDEGGPDLSFTDESGKVRSWLRLNSDGPNLSFCDESGAVRSCLRLNSDGPDLTFYDESGNARAVVDLDDDGPAMTLYDRDGEVTAQLRPEGE